MAIKASSSKHIDALIAGLGAVDAVAQETAIARLAVLGARAVERLITAATAGDAGARAGAWRVLEAIGDPRALQPALDALADAGLAQVIGIAATGVVRVHLRGAHGASALDRLATVLLDRARPEEVRLAALRAMRDLDAATIAPILTRLADDASAAIRAEAGTKSGRAVGNTDDPATTVTRAAEAGLPVDPDALRHAIGRSGAAVALPVLLRIVERVREREASESAVGRGAWTQTRAAAHVALAHRGSRVALYDLRESIEAATPPLPVEFLTALSLIGDSSCLEAIAGAHARAKDSWWRQHLADAFRTIVTREKLTRRHALMKKIKKRWPSVFV